MPREALSMWTASPVTLVAGWDTRWLYVAIILLVAAERLMELAISSRNVRWARARGAVEAGRSHYRWMVLLHVGLLVACPLEVWVLDRPFIGWLAAASALALALSMALRYWVVATLGRRWTTRVLYLPGEPLVTGGPFRLVRHPNYVAVAIEFLALPLLHGAWLTAVVGSLLDAALLRVRIRVEEAALECHAAGVGGRSGA